MQLDAESTDPGIDLDSLQGGDDAGAGFEPESTDAGIQLDPNPASESGRESESIEPEVASSDFEPESTDPGIPLQIQAEPDAAADFQPESTSPEAHAINADVSDPESVQMESDEESIELPDGDALESAPAHLDAAPAHIDAAPAHVDAAAPDPDDHGFAAGSGGFAASADDGLAEDVLAEGSGGITTSATDVDGSMTDLTDKADKANKANVIAAALASMAESAPPARTTDEIAAQTDLAAIDGSPDAIVEPVD
ncbi:MAG: hypothetical protein H0V17_03700 [Deltaproteobacteria bacterium]|nr:hypothetical protein [Deltaproteobacteria bacterium]